VNISLSEIIVILLVALLVIKPEQLPDVALKLGKWTKSMRKTYHKVRQEIDGTVNQLSQELKAPSTKPEIDHDRRDV
jgi:sec-independent protein translocase protein TatB